MKRFQAARNIYLRAVCNLRCFGKACLISPSKHLQIEMDGVGAKIVLPILHGIQKLSSAILFEQCKVVLKFYGSCQPTESPLEEFQPKDRAPELVEKDFSF